MDSKPGSTVFESVRGFLGCPFHAYKDQNFGSKHQDIYDTKCNNNNHGNNISCSENGKDNVNGDTKTNDGNDTATNNPQLKTKESQKDKEPISNSAKTESAPEAKTKAKTASSTTTNTATTSATTTTTKQTKKNVPKVKVHFVAVGSAPLMKKSKFLIARKESFSTLQQKLMKMLQLKGGSKSTGNTGTDGAVENNNANHLFLYLHQSFVPSPEDLIGDLDDLFSVRGELILHYSLQEAWG